MSERSVNVLCLDNGSERYDGRTWTESIDSIIEINGGCVDGKTVTPESLKNGDKVKYKFNKKIWNGIIAETKHPATQNLSTVPDPKCSKSTKRRGDPVKSTQAKKKKTEGIQTYLP